MNEREIRDLMLATSDPNYQPTTAFGATVKPLVTKPAPQHIETQSFERIAIPKAMSPPLSTATRSGLSKKELAKLDRRVALELKIESIFQAIVYGIGALYFGYGVLGISYTIYALSQ